MTEFDDTEPDDEGDIEPIAWHLTRSGFNRHQAAAWESGMRHALAWLGLKQYGDVMAADNPHKDAE